MDTVEQVVPAQAPSLFRENLLQLGSKLFPHDTPKTTCPPAPLVNGEGPLIIVASIMRSGTHLLLDSLFNNFPTLRRSPLFVDFDACERVAFPAKRLAAAQGVVIKTHYPMAPLPEAYASALTSLAARAVVIKPTRPAPQVRKSLAKWGISVSEEEFLELEWRFEQFWAPYSPQVVTFSSLLNSEGLANVIRLVQENTGLQPRAQQPMLPAQSRLGVYIDKALTRAFGSRVPRINTTIGIGLK